MKNFLGLVMSFIFVIALSNCGSGISSDPCRDFMLYINKVQADGKYKDYVFEQKLFSKADAPSWPNEDVFNITGLAAPTHAKQYVKCDIKKIKKIVFHFYLSG